MKKLFISADIEGTCGIANWDETTKGKGDHIWFADQMTREVAAACRAALSAGYDQVLVKDAHDSARNIDPRGLPKGCGLVRGWGPDPMGMMLGLDESFSGAVMTGYHNAAGTGSNPLAHTWTTSLIEVRLNGELCSELYMNSLLAARLGVPVYAVSGDKGLCDWMREKSPNAAVIPVNEGMGRAVKAIHPDEAVALIEKEVARALSQPREACLFPQAESYTMELRFKDHSQARRAAFYPGASLVNDTTISYTHKDFYDVMRMLMFCS